jgi:hypothetical protein
MVLNKAAEDFKKLIEDFVEDHGLWEELEEHLALKGETLADYNL